MTQPENPENETAKARVIGIGTLEFVSDFLPAFRIVSSNSSRCSSAVRGLMIVTRRAPTPSICVDTM